MKMRLYLLSLAILSSGLAQGAVYRIVGPDGRVTFTDMPPGNQPAMELSLPKPGPASPTQPAALKPRHSEIVVYGTQTCPYCKRLRADLGRRGIPYKFLDVDANPAEWARIRARGVTGVPYTTSGNKDLSGYSASGLEDFLKRIGAL